MAWSDAARQAAIEARRRRGKNPRAMSTQARLAGHKAREAASIGSKMRLEGNSAGAAAHFRRHNKYTSLMMKLKNRMRDQRAYARQLQREKDEWGTLPGGQKVFGIPRKR